MSELNEQESPLKQQFDQFDLEHADWTDKEYIKYSTLQTDIEENNKLVLSDWKWRKIHKQNIMASTSSYGGTGKSMSFCYCGLQIGKIFEVEFTPKHVFFSPEELDVALSKSKPCETFLRDEHRKATAGIMSNFINDNLSDYEDQCRKLQNNLLFAAIRLQDHSHFFVFEPKHIVWTTLNGEPYPEKFINILKTPRYTNINEFVWRGYVSFPMPNPKFVEEYNQLKDQHLENLKSKYGNTLDVVGFYANQLFQKRELSLIRKTKEGFVLPIKKELMDFVIAEEIGTRRFTIAGYNLLNAKIKELIQNKYQEENEQITAALTQYKEIKILEKQQLEKDKQESTDKKREAKLSFFKEKLAEEKRKNDLKERALLLKEKAVIELAQLLKKKEEENAEKGNTVVQSGVLAEKLPIQETKKEGTKE